MNTATLLHAFSSAITWNGLLHIISQSFFLIRTALLYKYLTPHDFSFWANSTSVVFLLLLWLDCGFRKSIPRYAPQFGGHKGSWLYKIAVLQIIIQLAGLPFLYRAITLLTDSSLLLILIIGIYFVEGLHSLSRLIYHAHFLNKFFNQIALAAATAEISIILFLPIMVGDSSNLLIALLATKLFTTIGLIIAIAYQFQYQSPPLTTYRAPDIKQFALHSGAMWTSTILKSLTERNVLIPLITYYMGAEMGNICKLANDGALFLYRIVIKTIGSADTVLLAYIEEGYKEGSEKRKALEIALEKLTTQMARLSLPLLGLVGISMFVSYMLSYDQFVFHAFFIMAVGYLTETIWFPYERLLEVRRSYRILFISYVPYVLFLFILFLFLYISCIGLLPLLLLLQSVRLVMGFLLRTQVYRLFHI